MHLPYRTILILTVDQICADKQIEVFYRKDLIYARKKGKMNVIFLLWGGIVMAQYAGFQASAVVVRQFALFSRFSGIFAAI